MRYFTASVLLAALTAGALMAAPAQTATFFPIEDVRPGMVAVGRTVFAGDELSEFRANIIGVLRNALGPQRDMILARLEGGPLANTGVIQGMSGSPVYIDGKLVGAVSYALGSFPKEPLAGITPIREMLDAVDSTAPRPRAASLGLAWPASEAEVFTALGQLLTRAATPSTDRLGDLQVVGPASLAGLAPTLRPIGAAMVIGGFDAAVDRDLRAALLPAAVGRQSGSAGAAAGASGAGLRAGDPVGMSLVRGDLEMGATGTVTHVDGTRVYAFGHPFLGLGPTSFAMTRAHVFTILPSLDSSIKIAGLGPVIGTINQDRATAVAGVLGGGPAELEVRISLTSERAPERRFSFSVVKDTELTTLFTYVSIMNALVAYERQTGVLSVAARGSASFGRDGEIAFDEVFTGRTAATAVANAITTPISRAVANEFRVVMPERIDLALRTSEREEATTIERAWLDTTHPRLGGTHNLQVQLQDFRGLTRTVTLPLTMPTQADGPLTLFISGAAALSELEARDLKIGKPSSWPELLADLNDARRGNRLYVRLISSSSGTVVGGDTLPALPASVRSILDKDTAVARTPVTRSVVGSWEQRLDMVVRGSRELVFTLTPQP